MNQATYLDYGQLARPSKLIHIDIKKLGRIGHLGSANRITGRKKRRTKTRRHPPLLARRSGQAPTHPALPDLRSWKGGEIYPHDAA